MYRVIAVVMLLCLLAFSQIGCFESQTASIYGNPESAGVMGMMLGTEVQPNLEVGAVAQYAQGEVTTTTKKRAHPGTKERRPRSVVTTTHEREDDWTYGVYAHYSVPVGPVSPYIGAQAAIGNGSDNIIKTIEPVAGVSLWDSISLEWQDKSLNGEDDKIMVIWKRKF